VVEPIDTIAAQTNPLALNAPFDPPRSGALVLHRVISVVLQQMVAEHLTAPLPNSVIRRSFLLTPVCNYGRNLTG
jgi:hypothetical protein